ncbi:hypothetical protein MY1884_009153, partial [Beauveria asiatica]
MAARVRILGNATCMFKLYKREFEYEVQVHTTPKFSDADPT